MDRIFMIGTIFFTVEDSMNLAHFYAPVTKSTYFFLMTCLLVLSSGSIFTAKAAASATSAPVQQTAPESHRIIVKLRPEAARQDQFGSSSLQALRTKLDVH